MALIQVLKTNQASCCITPVLLGGFLGRDKWQLYFLNYISGHIAKDLCSPFDISGSLGDKKAQKLEYLNHVDEQHSRKQNMKCVSF